MAPRDELEHYEATEAQDLTRLLRVLRPPAREVQVPPPVDLTIRAEIWQAEVRRQLSTLLSMARQELIWVIRQALLDNPLLEEVARAEDADAPADEAHTPRLTASADDPVDGEERYDSVWQACVPDGWDAYGLPAQASEAPSASEPPAPPRGLRAGCDRHAGGAGVSGCPQRGGYPAAAPQPTTGAWDVRAHWARPRRNMTWTTNSAPPSGSSAASSTDARRCPPSPRAW